MRLFFIVRPPPLCAAPFYCPEQVVTTADMFYCSSLGSVGAGKSFFFSSVFVGCEQAAVNTNTQTLVAPNFARASTQQVAPANLRYRSLIIAAHCCKQINKPSTTSAPPRATPLRGRANTSSSSSASPSPEARLQPVAAAAAADNRAQRRTFSHQRLNDAHAFHYVLSGRSLFIEEEIMEITGTQVSGAGSG